jgi:hypothetical protein
MTRPLTQADLDKLEAECGCADAKHVNLVSRCCGMYAIAQYTIGSGVLTFNCPGCEEFVCEVEIAKGRVT